MDGCNESIDDDALKSMVAYYVGMHVGMGGSELCWISSILRSVLFILNP